MSTFPFQDAILVAIFALVVGVTIGGALIAALSTRIIRGVSGLMLCCMGLGGLYYFLNSPFLALMEILIYVGAVCVTIVFGVMLSEPDEPAHEESRRHAVLWGGAALLVSLVILGGRRPPRAPGPLAGTRRPGERRLGPGDRARAAHHVQSAL